MSVSIGILPRSRNFPFRKTPLSPQQSPVSSEKAQDGKRKSNLFNGKSKGKEEGITLPVTVFGGGSVRFSFNKLRKKRKGKKKSKNNKKNNRKHEEDKEKEDKDEKRDDEKKDDRDDEGGDDKKEEEEEKQTDTEESESESSSDDDEDEKDAAKEEQDENYNPAEDPALADLEQKTQFPEEEEEVFDAFNEERIKHYDVLDKSIVVTKPSSYIELKFTQRKVVPPFPEGGWTWRPAKLVSESLPKVSQKKNKKKQVQKEPQKSAWKFEFIDDIGGFTTIDVVQNPECIAPYKSKTELESYHKYKKGDPVDILDIYTSARTKKRVKKWRSGKVLKCNAYWIRIHYDKFDHSWDEWFHMLQDKGRIVDHTRETGKALRRNRRQMNNFQKILNRKRNLQVIEMDADGNCLFRCVAHQVYGNPGKHRKVREECIQYMIANQERYALFVDNIADHIRKMRRPGSWGDEFEIRAMEEVYDRPFELYVVNDFGLAYKPTDIHFGEELPKKVTRIEPIRVSYHGNCHYNSIVPLDLKMTQNYVFKAEARRTTKRIRKFRLKMMRKANKEEERIKAESKRKEEMEKRKKELEAKEEEEENNEEKKPDGDADDDDDFDDTEIEPKKLAEIEQASSRVIVIKESGRKADGDRESDEKSSKESEEAKVPSLSKADKAKKAVEPSTKKSL